MDDKFNNVLPRACETCGRGQIFIRKNHPIQGNIGEMRQADLQNHCQLYQGNVIFRYFSGSTLDPLRVEAELIAKVLKEQAFVVARFLRDGIDACAIETVFREDHFCRVENSLPRTLCVMDSSSSTSRFSRFRHPLLISFL